MSKVLLIDAEDAFRLSVTSFLSSSGYEVLEAAPNEYGRFGDVHLDFVLIGLDRDLRSHEAVAFFVGHPSMPRVLCATRAGRVPSVVRAVKAGAHDVLEKPLDARAVYLALEAMKPEVPAVEPLAGEGLEPAVLTGPLEPDLLVAVEPRTKDALARIEAAGREERSIVLVCEPELARALALRFHDASPRRAGPFVAVGPGPKSGLSPEDLLFGTADVDSSFSRARGGVLFVESLASLGRAERLGKLLRDLEQSAVKWPPMVVATDEDPAIDTRLGRGVADQLIRHVVAFPRLFSRAGDLPRIVDNVVASLVRAAGAHGSAVAPSTLAALESRRYTGGMKELLSVMTEAARLDGDRRLVLDLASNEPAKPRRASSPLGWAPRLNATGSVQPFDVYEAEIFRFALENARGCVSRAAELLGVGRATMYRKMRAYDLDAGSRSPKLARASVPQ
jgi:DNA-binding NtrC family response regulator